MLTHWPLFDPGFLAALLEELRGALRGLLQDLCDDLEGPYQPAASALRLPVPWFRCVASALTHEDYSHWKVVGWIEDMNDLVYFLDVREQLRADPDPRDFAEAFRLTAQEELYEHGYLDELFPDDDRRTRGLLPRLSILCRRLARQVTQEAVFLIPGLACQWVRQTGRRSWSVRLTLEPNFERAEVGGHLSCGLEDGALKPPAALLRSFERHPAALLRITPTRMDIETGGRRTPLFRTDPTERWYWRWIPSATIDVETGRLVQARPGIMARGGRSRLLTVGPTLRYGRDRTPKAVSPSGADVAVRVARAHRIIRRAWPAGWQNLAALTSRVIPLQAMGVVSFSYRHRPGLSFLNCVERDGLDLIDDLVHENSHHHLNLFLRKAVLIKGDRNREIFYSPWRRSLRPLRGILHATFTFTMGALLFDRLSSGNVLSTRDVLRARFRCLEEIESVRFSLVDLEAVVEGFNWLTKPGAALVQDLTLAIDAIVPRARRYEPEVLKSSYGPALRRHRAELEAARALYGIAGKRR